MKPVRMSTDTRVVDKIHKRLANIERRLGGGSDPGPWQTLEAHLAPGWATPVNTSVSDLTDDFCPRYYVDRDRAYLGGVVQLTVADLGGFADYIVLDGLPSDILPARQIDLGFMPEDMYWTNSGWLAHTGIVATDPASLRIVTGGADDPIEDGVAISLEPFSWRIG